MASTNLSASLAAYPSTPSYANDLEFVTAYLTVHMLSDASRVYSYLLWIAIGAVLIICSLLHHFNVRGGYLGAFWSKWAIRRRTWRKKHSLAVAKARGEPHRQPYSLPPNAQIFTFVCITIASLLVAFLGPDYLAPGSTIWTLQNYPSATLAKRSGYNNADYFIYQPQYTISKAWWTTGNRTGLIAFALFPLCILFALKSPPFAIFSLSFLTQLYCDKLLWLHKWTARLIYFFTLLHVAFWSVELFRDRRKGQVAYALAWQYEKFLYAWIAFGCMTLLFLASIGPLRRKHYEAFWFLHVLLVPLTIIMAALHHPPVWWWCWAALAIWFGERMWRLTWWLYTNGYLGGQSASAPRPSVDLPRTQSSIDKSAISYGQSPKGFPPSPLPNSEADVVHYPPSNQLVGMGLSLPTSYTPPPGFAHAELLPGRTVRLSIVPPGFLTWAPGQHFLISVPSITRFTTHPFTVASVCDEQNQYDDGRVLVFLIRAKNGWTKDLWDAVALMISRGQQYVADEKLPRYSQLPNRGVLLRACVDGPYGSSVRASWGDYSSVLIVSGGSGVSYALSVLQYVCLCMAGRDGRFLGGRRGGYGQKGYKTTRVRFVWLVREFGHIQWCASVLRRCMDILPFPDLQIDIFVTNVQPVAGPNRSSVPAGISFAALPRAAKDEPLEPPRPEFALNSKRLSQSSFSSEESGDDSDLDLSYYTGMIQDEGELGHEAHILDLTNFEGDDDTALPGETQFHLSIKKEGRLRRAVSRRVSTAMYAKQELLHHASQTDYESPAHSSVQLVLKRRSIPPPIATNLSTPPRSNADLPPAQRPSVDIATARSSEDASRASIDAARVTFQGHSSQPSDQSDGPSYTPLDSAVPLMSANSRALTPLHTHNLSASLNNKRLSQLSSRTHSPMPVTPASSRLSMWTDTDSFAALVPGGDVVTMREQLRLTLDAQEVEDVGMVAEHARPGKPKLDRIVADEVERSKGAVAVACCGPTSLDAVMRKIVAAQIDPQRIRRGDMRGSIALFSEEFSY
ncbi:ferric reductase like transmembrane component-domain-containing protein [Daedaleopsis nitida]|nr:ferric reductase like transmembrane component-domain-containing protein [Daedaleopsis nitida]